MAAGLDDAALVHHHDTVGALHGGEAVGNDERGAVLHQLFQRGLHQAFAFRVERRGGFVEQQDGAVGEERTGDGDALALTAGQAHAALPQVGVVALRQLAHEFIRVSGVAGSAHVFRAGLGACIAHVLQHAGGEDHRLLRHQGDAAAHGLRVGGRERHAVEADAARLRIVEAQQQLEHRGLASAGGADQRHAFARRDGEAEVGQGRRVGSRGIVEVHAREGEGAARPCGQRLGVRRHAHIGLRREQFQQALGGAGGALQFAPGFRQGADGAAHQGRVEDKGGELPGADLAGEHVVAAHPEDEGDGAEHQHQDDDDERGAVADAGERGGEAAFHERGEIAPVGVLVTVGLHDADLVDGLVDAVAQVGDAVLADAGEAPHAPSEQHDGHHHQRHAPQHQQGQLQVGGEQHGQPADQQQDVAQGDGEARADGVFDQRRVGGQARDHRTGAALLDIRGRQRQQVVEDAPAQVGGDALAEPRDIVEAQVGGRREQGDDAEHGHQRAIEPGRVAGGEAPVDHGAQALAHAEHRRRRDYQGNGCEYHAAAVGLEQGRDDAGGRSQVGHGSGSGRMICIVCCGHRRMKRIAPCSCKPAFAGGAVGGNVSVRS